MARPPSTKKPELIVTLRKRYEEVRVSFDESTTLANNSQKALYETLGKAVGFVRLSLTKTHAKEFEKMCKEKDISTEVEQKAGANPFLVHARLLFTSGDEKTTPDFVYKYAKYLRHLVEQRVPDEQVVAYIEEAEAEKKTKLAAILALDSKAHPSGKGGSNTTDKAIEYLQKIYVGRDFGSLKKPGVYAPLNHNGLVVMVGEIQDETIVVRDFYNKDADGLKKLIAAFKTKQEKGDSGKGTKQTIFEALADLVA